MGGNVTILVGVSRTDAEDLRDYLCEVAHEANILPWGVLSEAMSSPDNTPPGVADIYTDLDTTRLEAVDSEATLRQFLSHIDRTRRVPAQQMANREAYLLITGGPGSGKSTFVKHMAYLLATAAQSQDADTVLARLKPWSHGALLPLYVELRSVAAYAAEHKMNQGTVRLFKQVLADLLTQWGVGSAWDALHRTLENGKTPAILLLDGLDEVSTAQRKLLVEMVNALAADPAYRRHRIIVTCRPYAYYDMPADHRLRHLTEVTLAPFSQEQVNRFVENWYRRLSTGERPTFSADEAQARRKDLHAAVRRRDHRSLARRPILLTMMVQLHTFKGRLPDDRVRLYKESVDLLLTRWNTRTHDQPSLREFLDLPDLKDENIEKALYEVAYRAHAAEPGQRASDAGDSSGDSDGDQDEPSADITEGDLRTWIRPYLGGSDQHAGRFIQYIRKRAGLLVRHKSEAYTFPHRSLQEYLAACHLTRSDDVDYRVDAAALVRADATRWREVFVLAAGYEQRYGKTSNAVAAVSELCPLACPVERVAAAVAAEVGGGEMVSAAHWTHAQIAGEALLEIGGEETRRSENGRALWARVQGWLAQLVEQPRQPPARVRTAASVTLAKLGDPRPEVTDPLAMEFCCVPAGTFLMGEDEEQQYTHDLDYTYWISRFPVTNAQFKAFMDAGGYADPRWWPEARQAGFWKDGKARDWRSDDFGRTAPYDYGKPFTLPNHPVVGVTWYAALAFVHWLETHYRNAGILPTNLHLHLPNEPEWEKAARGGLRLAPPTVLPIGAVRTAAWPVPDRDNDRPARRYPWGDDPDPDRANCEGSEIGATNAAGCFAFGASVYGVEELGGGVWEWTRTLWGKEHPYDAQDGREKLMAIDIVSRVLRGGSFYAKSSSVGCGVRSGSNPYSEDRSLGFRVVLSPFTSGLWPLWPLVL